MRRGPFVASALLFVGCTQGKSPDVAKGSPAADSDTHVVVVGAGLAGLTVARMLDEVGVTVTVVEARDRIGGRLWTEAVGGVPIDLGGAWVHGPRNNPLSDLADSAGVSLLEDDSRSNAGFDAVAGAAITEGQWQAMSDAYRGFPGELRALRRALGDDASLADGADAWIEEQDYKDPDTGQLYNREVLDAELSKIEKPVGIANPKDFRNEVVKFALRHRANTGKNPAWNSYEKLRDVIEKHMFSQVEELLPVISFGSKKDSKTEGKHQEFVERMRGHGYTDRQVRRLVEWYMRVNKAG